MNRRVKAVLLSAFVLPGLGQLQKGEKIKGFLLIMLVNLFLLIALFLIMKSLGPAIVAGRLSGTLSVADLQQQLQQQAPAGRWLLASFVGLWLFSVIDAARDAHHDGDGKEG